MSDMTVHQRKARIGRKTCGSGSYISTGSYLMVMLVVLVNDRSEPRSQRQRVVEHAHAGHLGLVRMCEPGYRLY